MKFTFTKPPALNHLYVTNKWGGKTLSREGRGWQEEALWGMRTQLKENWECPLELTVHLYTCRHQDNDSILKLLQDTMQLGQVYKDDYWIFSLHVYKHKCKIKDERIEVMVCPEGTS